MKFFFEILLNCKNVGIIIDNVSQTKHMKIA